MYLLIVTLRQKFLAILLASSASIAAAQSADDAIRAKDAEWMSYRDAYKSMLWFEKFGKAKNLIQWHLQVFPKDKNISIESLRLHILSKSTHLDLSLDPIGRASLPLLKAAYDENAELVLNQKAGQAGFRFRTSINLRADGIYEIADLRTACEQTLAFQSYMGMTTGTGRKCIGVRFAFAKKDQAAQIEIRQTNQAVQTLTITDNTAVWSETASNLKTGNYLFANASDKGQIITRTTPLVVIALIE
ncbi:hypothetical protein [Undibacterium fentianense]|uniref:Uncharacterized protein n=1 Tax=Undibacterium fentianense TaxID=2828728 RepID=A0A941DZ15_9BURK|nr:hypothetical protein [Undibacterium fentianense]MBR7799385.1 hypothetical protein [Undibacterium fentianense]